MGWTVVLNFGKGNKIRPPFPAEANVCRAKHNGDEPNSPIVGGHVIGFMEDIPHVYIVPMHSSCNLKKQNLDPFRVFRYDLIRVPYPDERAILNMKSNKLQIDRMKKYVQRKTLQRFRKLSGIG